MTSIEVTGARELIAAFDSAAGRVLPEARKVVQQAAINIKQGMQRDISGHAHFRQIARAISYDLGAGGLSAEIGPAHAGVGDLANIAYIGTSRGGGTVDLTKALRAEEPGFLAALDRAVAG